VRLAAPAVGARTGIVTATVLRAGLPAAAGSAGAPLAPRATAVTDPVERGAVIVVADRATRATTAATPSVTGPNGVIVVARDPAPVPTTSLAPNVGVDADLAMQTRWADDALAGPPVHVAAGTSVTLAMPRAARARASGSPPGRNASIRVLAPDVGNGGTAGPIGLPSVPTHRPVAQRATMIRTVDDRVVPVPNARIGRPDRTVPPRAASGGTIAVVSADASTVTGPDGVGTSVTATGRCGWIELCPGISAEASG